MDEESVRLWLEFITSLMSKELITQYRQCKNDEEYFTLALEAIVQNYTRQITPECNKYKNAQHSITSRGEGNKKFMEGQYYEAMKKYTESIVYAVYSSEDQALAYANRSAALFKLEKYADCVDDINRALDLKYPDRLKEKLHKRKELCFESLTKPDAEFSFQALNSDKENGRECEPQQSNSVLHTAIESRPRIPRKRSANAEIPCASDAVSLKYSEKFGRHVVATRRIKPGEILAVEKPYCMGLDPKSVYTHCSHCLQVSWTLIPCKSCVIVAYCSESCRDKAWNEYHEVECPVLRFLPNIKIYELLDLGVRMAIIATCKGTELDALKKELLNIECNQDPRTRGFCDDGKLYSSEYRSVHTLLENDKQAPEQSLSRALWVAFTVCILARESIMFGKELTLDTLMENPDVTFIGRLILKHVNICSINIHGVGATRAEHTHDHGNAVSPFCSLFNHSCAPNAFVQWYNDHLLVVAHHPIEEGEQIFETYGAHYREMKKPEREKFLKNWNFNCECNACMQDWPLLENLPSFKDQPITQQNKKKVIGAIETANRCLYDAMQMSTTKNIINMLNEIVRSIEILSKLITSPCAEFDELLGLLRGFYASADMMYAYELDSSSELLEFSSFLYSSLQYMLSQE